VKPDIVLVLPPHPVHFYQPIGIATLASHYREQGLKVEVLDAVAEKLNHKQVIKCLMKRDPATIGISIPFTEMAESGKQLLDMCTVVFHDREILVGGLHTEVCPEEFDGYTKVDRMELSPDLIPAWDLMPINKYDLTLYLSTKEGAFPVQASFGCPYACHFCVGSTRSEPVRYKSLDCLLDELEWVVKDFHIHGFHFWDETFTLTKGRVMAFCSAVLEKDLDIRWSAQTRAGLTDKELLKMMSRAGCTRLSFGVESGDEAVLQDINKKISLDDAREDIALAKEAGIVTYAGYMISHAKDTVQSIARTMEVSRELGTDYAGFRG